MSWAEIYPWREPQAGGPVIRQVYDQVREAIHAGALKPGGRLPSSRDLAQRLGVARASVVAAYDQLLAEGYTEGRKGSGTYVSGDLSGVIDLPASRAPEAVETDAAQAAMGFGRDVRQALFERVVSYSAREVNLFGSPSLITRITIAAPPVSASHDQTHKLCLGSGAACSPARPLSSCADGSQAVRPPVFVIGKPTPATMRTG